MKIVIIGGTGQIGTRMATLLKGHEVVIGSRRHGIDAVTGEGLAAALAGADVVVDVTNAPSWEDQAVLDFFRGVTQNVLAAGAAAGVKHYLCLGIVGTAGMQGSGYFRAKQAQEDLIRAGSIPYTIVQATQFFEFLGAIGEFSPGGHLPPALMQPIAADEVARLMVEYALGAPLNGTVEIAGPEQMSIHSAVERATGKSFVLDSSAGYVGTPVSVHSLTAGPGAVLSTVTLDAWLDAQKG